MGLAMIPKQTEQYFKIGGNCHLGEMIMTLIPKNNESVMDNKHDLTITDVKKIIIRKYTMDYKLVFVFQDSKRVVGGMVCGV